jgi:hypothetical protein
MNFISVQSIKKARQNNKYPAGKILKLITEKRLNTFIKMPMFK